MAHKCAICSRPQGVYELRFDADETDAGEEWSTYVCGTCWEVIAAIVRRVFRANVTAQRTGTAPE